MNKIRLFTKILDNVERKIITLLFIEVVVVGVMQVIWRFVFKASLSWSEELLRYSFVWITFLAASVAVPVNGHVNVGALLGKLNGKSRKRLSILNYVICLVFSILILFFSTKLLSILFVTNQKSAAMQLPMYVPYMAIVVSFFSMTIKFIVKIIDTFHENVIEL
jgi:C4-dicarboxylate transporter DctQ subunit